MITPFYFKPNYLFIICSSNKAKYILNIFVMRNISFYEKSRSQWEFSMSWDLLGVWLFLFPTIVMSNSWKGHASLFIHLFSCRWNNLTSTQGSEKRSPPPGRITHYCWEAWSSPIFHLVLSSSLPISCWSGLVTGTNAQQNTMAQAGMGT